MGVHGFSLAHWHWPTAFATAAFLLNAIAIVYVLATWHMLRKTAPSRYLKQTAHLFYCYASPSGR